MTREASGGVTMRSAGGVATVTLSSQRVHNALTPAMARELLACCDEIDADSQVGAAILIGAGTSFCSGADRRTWDVDGDQVAEPRYADTGVVYESFLRFGALAVPTIAAVRGNAIGAGLNLMLAADMRLVSTTARIFPGFVRIGLHPGGGYFTLSNRVAGREATAAMGLFDEEIDGARAVALGLAWELCADEALEDRAQELAARVARDPQLARRVVCSFREELGPPGIPWAVASEYERASQMWSQRRRDSA
ncbi:MAG TPA: enoyl-CoA hydratase/isomerase family protein [Acidimicrobiia bacterium]|nr:enoyl-CoA hydratase/isomerase family protein [Acidimicrobiia bacterium]